MARAILPALLLLGSMITGALAAETNATPQILFLHLKLKNQTISIIDSATRPGVLKHPQEAGPDAWHFEVVSKAGECVWKAALPDPTIRHLEYEQPAGSGKLTHKTVTLDEPEFTIRVPALSQAKKIDFYRLQPGTASATGEKSLTKIPLGSVLLP